MRAHTSEHRDALPVLDITALRHIAYVLDGFIYYMRNDSHFYEKNEAAPNIAAVLNSSSTAAAAAPTTEDDETDDELSNITSDDTFTEANISALTGSSPISRRHSFFARSDSTLSLGCLAPEGFDLPLDVAIPLADKPHLLQPNSKREDLFANLPLLIPIDHTQEDDDSPNILEFPPTKLGFSNYARSESFSKQFKSIDENMPSTSRAAAAAAQMSQGEWRKTATVDGEYLFVCLNFQLKFIMSFHRYHRTHGN